jgi:hypothetical protein
MSTSTPPAGRPLIPRPAGALLTKSAGGGRGGNDSKIFVTFANGLVRALTDVEYHCWDDVTIDYLIPVGAEYDYQWRDLVAYDAALRA